MRHNSSSVFIVGITYVDIDIFAFYGCILFSPSYPSLLLSLMFEHDCLDTCCLGCPVCMCFVFLYLFLFSAIDHASHGKAL